VGEGLVSDFQQMDDLDRAIHARRERERSAREAEAAREDLRHTVMMRPLPVEDKTEKWRRQGEEVAAAKAAAVDRRRQSEHRQLREQRQHEVALARVTGSADADVLAAIGQALNDVVDRIEKIEDRLGAVGARIGKVEGSNDGRRFAARLDALSARDEKSGRKMSAIEKRADQEHELVHDLAVEVKILKARIHALEKKPEPQDARELHVIHHDGR
jgi:hypothetical protein